MVHIRSGVTSTHILLAVIAVLLLLNLTQGLLAPAQAQGTPYGRYAISAFAYTAKDGSPKSGYYVLDTSCGQVTAHQTTMEY